MKVAVERGERGRQEEMEKELINCWESSVIFNVSLVCQGKGRDECHWHTERTHETHSALDMGMLMSGVVGVGRHLG